MVGASGLKEMSILQCRKGKMFKEEQKRAGPGGAKEEQFFPGGEPHKFGPIRRKRGTGKTMDAMGGYSARLPGKQD